MLKLTKIAIVVALFATFAVAQAPQEKSVAVFGAKIRYLEAGDASKPTVILLHGLGGTAENWQFTIPALATQYHVIAPDQVGFGKSDHPSIKYRIATFVDFLDKFMSELKIEKASLVGNSMGGWVAAWTAIKYPNRVEKLVLADAAGIVPPKFDFDRIYQLNNSTRDEIRANMKLIFANPALQNNEALVDQFLTARVTQNDGGTITSIIESIRRKEDYLNGQFSKIAKPTLIIWGKQDGLIPVADATTMNNGIKGSQLKIYDGCGHVPQFEKALDFNKDVLAFLGAK